MQSVKTAIGLMSGTSMDGIDAALIRSDGEAFVEIKAHMSFDYPSLFRAHLKKALEEAQDITQRHQRPGDLREVERELTTYHAQLVQKLLQQHDMSSEQVDLIGFHGQTILHRPQQGLTVQLGLGEELAHQTGIDVVYDMRANDVTHGGQGAPLVPAYHAALAMTLPNRIKFPCCFVNIGGIANLTYIPAPNMTHFDRIMAFDCGPGNCLIDQWMETRAQLNFDASGQAGLRGRICEAIIAAYWQHDVFNCPQPQSLDWHDFPPLCDEQLSLEDGAATLAVLSAKAIVHSFRFLPELPKTLIVSGGGTKNLCLMAALSTQAQEQGTEVAMAHACGLDADFIEAQAWAYLAIRSIKKLPLSFPNTTGVQFPVTGGIFTPA